MPMGAGAPPRPGLGMPMGPGVPQAGSMPATMSPQPMPSMAYPFGPGLGGMPPPQPGIPGMDMPFPGMMPGGPGMMQGVPPMAPFGMPDLSLQYGGPLMQPNPMSPLPGPAMMPGMDMAMPPPNPMFPGAQIDMMHYPAPVPPEVDRKSTVANLRYQMEFYFGIDNLCKDMYLRRNMDEEGWVTLPLVAGFNRIRNITVDPHLILEAVTDSDVIELDAINVRIRAKHGWERWVLPKNQDGVPGGPNSPGLGGIPPEVMGGSPLMPASQPSLAPYGTPQGSPPGPISA